MVVFEYRWSAREPASCAREPLPTPSQAESAQLLSGSGTAAARTIDEKKVANFFGIKNSPASEFSQPVHRAAKPSVEAKTDSYVMTFGTGANGQVAATHSHARAHRTL